MFLFGRGGGLYVRQDTSEASELRALRDHIANLAALISGTFVVFTVLAVVIGRGLLLAAAALIVRRVLVWADQAETVGQYRARLVILALSVLVFALSTPAIMQAWPPVWYGIECDALTRCYNTVGIGTTPKTATWLRFPMFFLFLRAVFAVGLFFTWMFPAFIMARRNIQSAQYPTLDQLPRGYAPIPLDAPIPWWRKLIGLAIRDSADQYGANRQREPEPQTVEVWQRTPGGARMTRADAPIPSHVFERFMDYVRGGGVVSERAVVSARVMTQRQWRVLSAWLVENGLARWRNERDHRQGLEVMIGGERNE